MNDYEFDDIEQDTPPADDHGIELADSQIKRLWILEGDYE